GGGDLDVAALAEEELERLAEDVVVLDQDDTDRHPPTLLGGQEEVVVRLTALPDVTSTSGCRSASRSRKPFSGGASSPVRTVSTLREPASRRSTTSAATSSNRSPPATG